MRLGVQVHTIDNLLPSACVGLLEVGHQLFFIAIIYFSRSAMVLTQTAKHHRRLQPDKEVGKFLAQRGRYRGVQIVDLFCQSVVALRAEMHEFGTTFLDHLLDVGEEPLRVRLQPPSSTTSWSTVPGARFRRVTGLGNRRRHQRAGRRTIACALLFDSPVEGGHAFRASRGTSSSIVADAWRYIVIRKFHG